MKALSHPYDVTSGKDSVLKTVAFVFALLICAFGLFGMVMPTGLTWFAERFTAASDPGPFYLAALFRIVFGLILIAVASSSRVPKALRILGYIIAGLGIATVLVALLAFDQVRESIDWWLHQSPMVLRLTGFLAMALGGFIAYACAPHLHHHATPTGHA